MLARYGFATLVTLAFALPAQAQFFHEPERWHERFHEHHPPPPVSIPAEPRRPGFEEHVSIPRHPVEPARPGHGGDGSICDATDADPDAAIAACGRIIGRGPVKGGYPLTIAYVHRGQAYENKADHADAIADFSAAILREPKVAGYFALRGAAQEQAGNADAAQADFRHAILLDPKNQEALNSLKRIETRSAVSTGGAPAPPPTATAPAASAAIAAVPVGAAVGGAAAGVAAAAVSPLASSPGATVSAPPPAAAAPPDATGRSSAQAASGAAVPPAAQETSAAGAVRNSPSTVVASASPTAPVAVPPTAAPSAAALPAAAAPAEQNTSHGPRVALVIGNGAYVNANALPNPPNDAHAIAGVLRQIGFDVEEGENLKFTDMENLLHSFLHKAQSASVVLLFYAGHGMQVDGKNYLIPVDAKLAEASDLPFETIEIDKLLDSLGDPGHTNIILLDACRDNPLARSFASHLPATRSAAVATGLAAYSAVGTGTLIAYATAPGQTALDGQGKDSPFTTSLLHYLPTPGLEIRQVLTRVRAEVAAETGNRQIPWDNSSLMGDVVLVNPPAVAAKTADH